MIYVDLIFNLALLVALSVISGFIDRRWPRSTRFGVLMQGALFGGAAVIGMLRPLNMGFGLIFDGRSVMISLCALFFGPWAASMAILITIPCRIGLGGVGMIMGVLVILSSAGIGLVARFRLLPATQPPSMRNLYLFGLAVHLVMIALMFTLPGNISMSVVKRIGIPVILLYPLATILIGKILSDQLSAIQYVEALRRSEKFFDNIIENIPIMIFMKDAANLRYIKFNRAGEELLGYSREELLGKSDYDLFSKRQAEFFTEKDREVLQSGKLVEIQEETITTRHLGERVVHTKKISIADKQGRPEYLLGISEDITERKKSEDALRESERRLREVQEMAHLGSWYWDVKTGDVEWSEEVYKIFRLDPKEFTPHIDSILALSPWPKDHQRDKELISRAIETHCPGFYEQKFLLPDKSIGYYHSTFQGNYDVKGELISIAGTVIDITERKKAEEEIIRLNAELGKKVEKQTNELRNSQLALLNLVDDLNASTKNIVLVNQTLEATNKELEAFSYSVSHDLRAPLRSIDGFSQALLEDYKKKIDDTGRNYLDKISKAAQHMGTLIDDMLKLARVARAEFRYESVDLSKMFKEIAKKFQKNNPDRIVDVIIQKGIIIEGDPDLMHIVLTNLIDNAWKFTRMEARPKIEFGMNDQAGKEVVFIRDNGAGFDMTYVGKLFGAFQRLHTMAEFEGTGIGLATVQRVINRHGGKIWAEGEVGKGATFYFTLP